ncbi:hypothetical protein M9H77_08707 [Catharanthus roseus]|uniref:Uncharacterized protein n=1 Tax=Catharanthus roseus TaxID=4058 RepID=A0ACC0BYT2_CATRO|nr:hypothetical protein M9H77_08707 [Catharanthus roseus]
MICWFKSLIHFMKVDTKEDHKLEVEEEERTLVFSEDLNGWIEKSEDDCQEGIIDKEESSEDQEIKLKIHNANKANGIVVFIEEALKNKLECFEAQGKASKLFSICSISKDHSTKQTGGENG